jgi:DUF4097 and DUF4098 domain-containing protein YvlB
MLLWLGLGLAATPRASVAFDRLWTGRYTLPPGGRLAVENVHGALDVEGWDRAEVEVQVTKTAFGSGDRLDDVRIAVEVGRRSLTFRTLYPGDLDEPIQVNYRLRVPRQARLERLQTLEGDITVRDVEGVVDARSLDGDINQINVTGSVVARTVNGNIAVWLRAMPEGVGPLLLDTVNGNLELLMPSRPNADLELSTVAGRVESPYLLAVSSVPGDTTRRTRLGQGGVRVSLRTVRGNIRVGERDDLL